jgi:hypothetical protein
MDQIGLNAILQRKVNDFVSRSRIDSERIYSQLENRHIDDQVIPASLISFGILNMKTSPENTQIAVRVSEDEKTHLWRINRNSAQQMGAKLGLPSGWIADGLNGQQYQQQAVSFALNKYMENYSGRDNRFLFRNVDGVVRGFLSTSYKRLNTREIFMKFIETAEELGLPLVGALEGTARDYLEVIDPHLMEIRTPNNGVELYARGFMLKNGDFGGAKLEGRSYWLKAVCLNGAVGQTYLKEVHLGSRLAQEFMFSLETVSKDTEVRALMIRDSMRFAFSEQNRVFEEAQIVEASDKTIDLKQKIEHLPKLGVNKTEKLAIEELLMKRDDEDGITGRPSMLMLSNAVSAYANRIDSGERKRELQQIAGDMIFTKPVEKVLEFEAAE